MRYADAIDWLREKGIKNTEGNDHVFGDDMYVVTPSFLLHDSASTIAVANKWGGETAPRPPSAR